MVGKPFLFGKLPAQGDFVSRGMTEPVLARWDEWAGKAMARAHDEFGDRFEAAHESAPPWCFVSGPGAFGDAWRTGALAPSTDSVGRRFILVVGADSLEFAEAVGCAFNAGALFVDTIYAIFTEGLDASAAEARVAHGLLQIAGHEAAALAQMLAPNTDGAWWPHIDGDSRPWAVSGGAPEEDLLLRVLNLSAGDPR